MNHPEDSHTEFLEDECRTYPDLLLRIVIDAEAKSEIRDMLDQNGISERNALPRPAWSVRLAEAILRQGLVRRRTIQS